MLTKTFASAVHGIEAQTITVEVNVGGAVASGKQYYFLVGLPDNAVKEGFQRIESAIKNIGYKMPRIKMVVNLAPADMKKEGSAYDLPIAMGVLASTSQICSSLLDKTILIGELALDGSVRPIKGALPIALQSMREGFQRIILPKQNAKEASVVSEIEVVPVNTLQEAIDYLEGNLTIHNDFEEVSLQGHEKNIYAIDFADVKGQENIKRAMEIAAAGGHNVILIGPPGAGKTMLARRLPTILPPLNMFEALETTKIHSVAGLLGNDTSLVTVRPFRSPHHTTSDVALVGGGSNPVPGEISLAHNGVLFLDELPEFKRQVLEVMRQPMEERKVTISRAKTSVDYPASFMLIASMNPCPCGYYNHPTKECVCPPGAVKKYLSKISGPLLDRIDLHVEVTPVSYDELSDVKYTCEPSQEIASRVVTARAIQEKRFKETKGIFCNAQMPGKMVRHLCELSPEGTQLLKVAMTKMQLSARAYDRILKVARTAADLAGSEHIKIEHLAEAIQYRNLDRDGWAG